MDGVEGIDQRRPFADGMRSYSEQEAIDPVGAMGVRQADYVLRASKTR